MTDARHGFCVIFGRNNKFFIGASADSRHFIAVSIAVQRICKTFTWATNPANYANSVFIIVFCPFHVNIDIFRNAGCLQGFQRGAYRQLRVKEVSCDMKAVFRDSRDCLGYVPYNIALPVVRVYGDFIFGYNIGACFIRVCACFIRFDFVASNKSTR